MLLFIVLFVVLRCVTVYCVICCTTCVLLFIVLFVVLRCVTVYCVICCTTLCYCLLCYLLYYVVLLFIGGPRYDSGKGAVLQIERSLALSQLVSVDFSEFTLT